jgi:hypothetical protein
MKSDGTDRQVNFNLSIKAGGPLAQSFSPFSARDGQQMSPSYEFQCDQNARRKENSTARFLKQNKFSFYFQNTSFFGLGKKNLTIKKNQLNSSHTENHTRPTNLLA